MTESLVASSEATNHICRGTCKVLYGLERYARFSFNSSVSMELILSPLLTIHMSLDAALAFQPLSCQP